MALMEKIGSHPYFNDDTFYLSKHWYSRSRDLNSKYVIVNLSDISDCETMGAMVETLTAMVHGGVNEEKHGDVETVVYPPTYIYICDIARCADDVEKVKIQSLMWGALRNVLNKTNTRFQGVHIMMALPGDEDLIGSGDLADTKEFTEVTSRTFRQDCLDELDDDTATPREHSPMLPSSEVGLPV